MSNQLPPCDHDECGPSACKKPTLKPCPHCNGTLAKYIPYHPDGIEDVCYIIEHKPGCFLEGYCRVVYEAQLEAWNTRAPQSLIVREEPEDMRRDEAEHCVRCDKPTRYWLGHHVPLCPECAESITQETKEDE